MPYDCSTGFDRKADGFPVTRRVPLLALAHARSGDKGNTANVGVIAYDEEDYPLLLRQLTAERVKSHMGALVQGPVERFELPNLHALNFLLHGALGGGGTLSLLTDAQGKVLSSALLRMEIEVPDAVARRVRGRGRYPGARDAAGQPGARAGRRNDQAAPGPDRAWVLSQTTDGVARVALNRPESRNALHSPMIEELLAELARLGADPAVRVVALRGAEGNFCAGADLGELAASQSESVEAGLAQARRLGDLFVALRRLPKPVVAVVEGWALGGGCGLALACDLVVAHEEARFGFPEVRIGFVPALVMAVLVRKASEPVAFELAAGGRRVSAAEAASLRLVSRVFGRDAFEPAVHEYLAELADRPPSAVATTKRLLYGLEGASFEDAISRGAEINALARHTEECREGVARFLGPRRDGREEGEGSEG